MSRLVCPSAKPSSTSSATRATPALLFLLPPVSRHTTVLLVLLLAVMEGVTGVSGIGCFVCSSFDGENKGCEDPFNSTMDLSSRDRDASSVANYNYPCWAYKKGRHGLFPADHCIKIVGYRADNESKTLVIRTCALDSGTLTADTEIVRISHCGSLNFAIQAQESTQQPLKFDEMTASLIQMANHLDASTEQVSLNYVLLGRPHRDKTQSHPSYMEMIKGAIQAIDNGKGSSKAAILKYIAQNYHVGENLPKVNSHLRAVLKKAVDNGDIEQTRGHGGHSDRHAADDAAQGGPSKMENVSVSKKTDKNQPSTSGGPMKTKKKYTMKKTGGTMGKKRLAKNKMAPKAKKGGLKKEKPSEVLEHKGTAGLKPEGPATTRMALRTGTRKSYC
ncbi:unnamed protein product [Caenorhabditis sp. 36 PRJEB53466]|nr:unnamed protein product [Caenorhabditis sp. 36 PRJEB53466]